MPSDSRGSAEHATIGETTIRTQRRPLAPLAWAAAISVVAAAAVAVEHGHPRPPLGAMVLGLVQVLLPWAAMVICGDVRPRRFSRLRYRHPVGLIGELLAIAAMVCLAFGGPPLGELLAVASALSFALRLNGLLARSIPNPTILFPASFLLLITVSAGLLKLPAATPAGQPIGWVDAFFTATSAVCVTGLVVRDTAEGFTFFGQAVVLASIQLGGLGVMIFGSTLALLFGARLSHREHLTLSKALDEYPAHRIARFAWFIVLITLSLEAVGALVLWLTWPDEAAAAGPRAWHAVFHSVSAFCNAGFDITSESMIGVRRSPAAFLGILPMIILGGLGFLVLEELLRRGADRIRRRPARGRLSTHIRVVLVTTAALLLGGAVVIGIAQSVETGGLSAGGLLDALFMSTTARTAGFTTVPMDELSAGSRFAIMLLMLVGGSPGSTAGGMKTVVFAVLVLAIVSTIRGRSEVEVFGRSLPDALVKRAATLAAGTLGVIALSTLVLDLTETIAFEPLLFEVISAASTTGLSLGATEELSPVGRVLIALTMFMGRVGALALMASLLGLMAAEGRYRLPRDTVSLG